MYTLILIVYRALLTSAILGTDHRIYITKETSMFDLKVGIRQVLYVQIGLGETSVSWCIWASH